MKIQTMFCWLGLHKFVPVWELRPETKSNPQGLGVIECIRCHRLSMPQFELVYTLFKK